MTIPDRAAALDLQHRTGWPADLTVLLEKYPREVWPAHDNLGQTARFWLQRHTTFRELGGMLQNATTEFREGLLPARQFGAFFAPRLQFFLEQLEAHHHVDDAHYFPVFRAAETRLVRGFDVLEGDHEHIHRDIQAVIDAANGLLRQMDSDADARLTATDTYAGTSGRLLKSLLRHSRRRGGPDHPGDPRPRRGSAFPALSGSAGSSSLKCHGSIIQPISWVAIIPAAQRNGRWSLRHG